MARTTTQTQTADAAVEGTEETTAAETTAAPVADETPAMTEAAETAAPQDAPPSSIEDSPEPTRGEDQIDVQPAAAAITVTIIGPKQGRWRAGRHFSAEPTVIEIDTLTESELEALRGDPMLSIVVG